MRFEAITDALRLELQPWGIRVALIAPGAIATPIWGKTRKDVDAWDATWSQDLKNMYREGFTCIKEAATAAANKLSRPAVVTAGVARPSSQVAKTRYLVGSGCRHSGLPAPCCFPPDRLNDWIITDRETPARR